MIQRKIETVNTTTLHQGFLGEGHLAAAVIDGTQFENSDPFILLMDDQLDLPGGPPVGGPHPHAGFETVTLVLQGDDVTFKTGSLELMTAGKGIIHTEEITTQTKMRILQLWLVLPPEKRWTEPFFQQILLENVPTHKTNHSEIKVYSGSSQGLTSPLKNNVPFTLVDFSLDESHEVLQEIPASYNGFIYVVEGEVWVGTEKVEKGQIAWLDRPEEQGDSSILIKAGTDRTRFVLYAGEPQLAPIVSHGPFIADSQEDIKRLYREYREGKMPHLNDLPKSQQIIYDK